MTNSPVAESTAWSEFCPMSGDDAKDPSTTEVLDAVGVPIVILRDFIVVYFNRAAADILGLAPAHIQQSPRNISILGNLKTLSGGARRQPGLARRHNMTFGSRIDHSLFG